MLTGNQSMPKSQDAANSPNAFSVSLPMGRKLAKGYHQPWNSSNALHIYKKFHFTPFARTGNTSHLNRLLLNITYYVLQFNGFLEKYINRAWRAALEVELKVSRAE